MFNFWALGLIPGPKFTKIGDDLIPTRFTILPSFITLRQPTPETFDIKHLRTNKQTKEETANDRPISPACLSACGDNKLRCRGKASTGPEK